MSADAVTVVLVRHGRTMLNADGRLRGRLDPPLDEVGLDEVAATAACVARLGPALVVASPLTRARQTALAVGAAAAAEVVVEDRLADRDYGPAGGLTPAEAEARWGSLDAVPGCEPAAQVLARARAALEAHADDAARAAVRDGGTGEPVLVLVAHDVVNRLLLHDLAPGLGPVGAIPQGTGCWNVLRRDHGSWRVLGVDQRAGGGERCER